MRDHDRWETLCGEAVVSTDLGTVLLNIGVERHVRFGRYDDAPVVVEGHTPWFDGRSWVLLNDLRDRRVERKRYTLGWP